MESNRVIAGTIGLFIVICLVGAVLAPMINDWATGERITNEGAGWLRMDYTEVTESSNYSMAVSLAGGTITVTDTNSATQSGADDTIAYASSTLAIWTDSGTIQILGTDPDGDPYYATASSSVNVWYSLVLGQIIKIDGSEDAITFATPTWAYLPLANGTYGFFDNGTSVQMEEGKSIVAVGGGFAGVYAYSNLIRYEGLGLEMQTTQDTDGLLNGAYWAKPAAQQDQRQITPITLDPIDPGLIRVDLDPEPDAGVRSVPTPTYTDGDWGYDLSGSDATIVSYSGAGGGAITIPATVGGYSVVQVGKGGSGETVFNTSLSATDIIISSGITTIGNNAFYNCTGFTGSLTIPSSVTSIGSAAFYNCKNLTGSLTIPSSVTSIGDNAFSKCKHFTGSLTIPSSVTSIGNRVFNECSGLTGSLTIPSSVTSIGNEAFYMCTGFTGSLTIPSSVTTIGQSAFGGCAGFTGTLIIPSSVTSIGVSTFDGCTGFTGSLTIPSSVTTIGQSAFNMCAGFTGTLIIPSSVTTIGQSAFNMCAGFTGTLIIPSSVTTIGQSAFNSCKFTDVIIASDATPSSNAFYMTTVTDVLDLSETVDYSQNHYGLPAGATYEDNIGDALGYISFVEKGSDPLVPAGAAAVMLAIPVVILGALIVVAATTFIRKD